MLQRKRLTDLIAAAVLIPCLFFGSCYAQNYKGAEAAKGLPVGDQAPDFNARDANGKRFSLSSALRDSVVVLIFFRGYWCPVCNQQLATIQDSLQLITQKGAWVVAVSPEKPEYLKKTTNQTGAKFRLLYDEGYKISDAYGITYLPSAMTRIAYNAYLNNALKKNHSDDSQRLPIPATYIINKLGTIVWRHVDADYKKRPTVLQIIQALELDGISFE